MLQCDSTMCCLGDYGIIVVSVQAADISRHLLDTNLTLLACVIPSDVSRNGGLNRVPQWLF
jgi:hypothetical protein